MLCYRVQAPQAPKAAALMVLLSRKQPSGLALNVSTNVPQRAHKNGIFKNWGNSAAHAQIDIKWETE